MSIDAGELSTVLGCLSLAISTWVIWRSSKMAREARREWVSRWKDDPETLAIVLDRLGWIERRRLIKELEHQWNRGK